MKTDPSTGKVLARVRVKVWFRASVMARVRVRIRVMAKVKVRIRVRVRVRVDYYFMRLLLIHRAESACNPSVIKSHSCDLSSSEINYHLTLAH